MNGDPVDVFDVSPPDPCGTATAAALFAGPAGRGGPGRRGRRSAGDLPDGVPAKAAGIAAVLGLIAVLVAVGVWRYRDRTVTTVRTVSAGSPVAVDAAGCPVADRCRMGTGSGSLYAAVLGWDPAAVLVTSTDVQSSAGAALRSTVVADTSVSFANGSPLERARSVLVVVAQCVPGGSVVPSVVRADAARRVQTVTVLGRPGCSVTVTSEAEDGVAVPFVSLIELAHRPGMQL